ncbi:hypothetical protein GFC01_17250 [Desulfofundulus thermobenzoicus]|uniref:DUF4320 family protein n=1 Tax=Desulfofundulus thermobenzoicus TaxID=29376 RepID=A0A6N7IV62_9FIRM|nr:hypothetical protein [Desulfofundulus thermobenzoicus]MQL53972.1 hypothetical protein [Desulfofundulus thermobenzoicus]
MLDKIITFIGILIFFLFCFFSCVVLYVGMVEWFQLQSEANLIADSMAQYGGYTNIANQQLKTFCEKGKLNPGAMTVTVEPSGGPVPYGQPVSVRISYPFNQVVDAGIFSSVINFPMRVSAGGVSHYVTNMVTGTSPVQVHYCTPSL